MDATIDIGWQVTYDLARSAIGRTKENKFFSFEEPSAFAKRIGASDQAAYHPILMKPKDTFHKKVRGWLEETFAIRVRQKNFPYIMSVPSIGDNLTLVVQLRLYLPSTLSIKIQLLGKLPFSVKEAYRLRRLPNHATIAQLSDYMASLVRSSIFEKNGRQSRTSFAAILQIRSSCSVEEFEHAYNCKLADILINHQPDKNSGTISSRIWKKNEEHNLKSEGGNVLLADKMGIISFVVDGWEKDADVKEQIKRKYDLFELAVALRSLYSHPTGLAGHDDAGWYFLVCCSYPFIYGHRHTFNISYSNSLYWSLLDEEFALTPAFESVTNRRPSELTHNLGILRKLFVNSLSQQSFWVRFVELAGEAGIIQTIRHAQNVLINIGDITVGDDFSNSNNIAGSIGSGSTANSPNVQAHVGQVTGRSDGDLQSELFTLLKTMREEANTVDKKLEVENVEKALEASKDGKNDYRDAYLRRAGSWTLSVAEKIGVALTAATLKTMLMGS